MQKIIISILLLTGLLVLFGCSYNEGIVLTDKPAYLQFLGDATNAEILINETILDAGKDPRKISEKLYQYDQGYHEVTIYKNGQTVYKQIVLLENGKTTQVVIP